MLWVWVVLGTVLVLGLIVGLIVWARRAATGARGRADAATDVRMREDVRSLGVTSLGRGQARGNGTLVLTGDALRFFQWVPAREFTIPLAQVTAVEEVRSHLGKTVGARLVKVTWETSQGPDSIAIQAPGHTNWLAALQRS